MSCADRLWLVEGGGLPKQLKVWFNWFALPTSPSERSCFSFCCPRLPSCCFAPASSPESGTVLRVQMAYFELGVPFFIFKTFPLRCPPLTSKWFLPVWSIIIFLTTKRKLSHYVEEAREKGRAASCNQYPTCHPVAQRSGRLLWISFRATAAPSLEIASEVPKPLVEFRVLHAKRLNSRLLVLLLLLLPNPCLLYFCHLAPAPRR